MQDKNGDAFHLHRLRGDGPSAWSPPVAPAGFSGDKPERESDDVLNRVYRRFIKLLDLADFHAKALRNRGLTDEEIARRGYRTLPLRGRANILAYLLGSGPPKEVRGTPGVYLDEKGNPRLAGSPGLVIPCLDLEGRVVSLLLRPDRQPGEDSANNKKEKRPKYCSFSCGPNRNGPTQINRLHVPRHDGLDLSTIRVTEGALKADVATALSGVLTLGTPGLSWRLALPALEALKPTRVLVAYDRDAASNGKVAHATIEAYGGFRAAGFDVALEAWPDEYKGVDDALAAGAKPEAMAAEDCERYLESLTRCAGGGSVPPTLNPATSCVIPPGRPRVLITPDEHFVTLQVTNVLATDGMLFQRQGVPVRPLVLDQGDTPRLSSRSARPTRPAGLTVLRPAETAFVRTRVTELCYLEMVNSKEELVHAHPPPWLAPNIMVEPGAIRAVHGVLPGPTLDADGRLISTPGYDAVTGWYLGRDLPGLDLLENPTREDAVAASNVLEDLVGDFPWCESADLARWLCLLLTACGRHLIGRTPLGLITANLAGSGKTYLARLISIIAHGLQTPILMSWPEGSELQRRGDEIRKRLASLLHESASLALMDNLPRGEDFGSTELDGFVTADAYHDRLLGKNDGQRVGGPNRCLLLATGNAVMPYGDTADRTLVVRLLCRHANPRARPPEDYRVPDLERHALDERPRYLGAALTIWRAWILAGKPTPKGPAWGTFEQWVDSVVAMVRWLGLPDPLADRVRQMSEMDRESQALAALLARWHAVLGTDPVGCSEIRKRLDGDHPTDGVQAMRDALADLGAGGRWPPGPSIQKLGKAMAGYKDRPVEIKSGSGQVSLRGEYNNNVKSWRYWVGPFAGSAGSAGIPHTPPNSEEISCESSLSCASSDDAHDNDDRARVAPVMDTTRTTRTTRNDEPRETFEV